MTDRLLNPAQVTLKLNEVYSELEAEIDPVLAELQRRTLDPEESWADSDGVNSTAAEGPRQTAS
jgi:hypothetical protein